MTTAVAIVENGGSLTPFESSVARQLDAERSLLRAIVFGTAAAIPVGIALFLGLLALAISSKQPWYVWVGLSVGLGTLGSILLGVLIGATVKGHLLDVVDQDHHVSGA